MSASFISRTLPALALAGSGLILAAPALAQDWPAPQPFPAQPLPAPAPGPAPCTIVVIIPGGPGTPGPSCAPQTVTQEAPPQPPQVPPTPYYLMPAPYYGTLPPQPPVRGASVFSAKLWAGPSYQRFYDLTLYGADLGVSLGAQRGISGWYGEIEANFGRTEHGLSTYQGWFGGSWEGTIDRLRLGVGVHVGFLGVQRATTGDLITGIGAGFFGFASVDLIQSDAGHALYVAARMSANWMDGGPDSPLLWGPNASLGWRY
jgi:hypothetical protein